MWKKMTMMMRKARLTKAKAWTEGYNKHNYPLTITRYGLKTITGFLFTFSKYKKLIHRLSTG